MNWENGISAMKVTMFLLSAAAIFAAEPTLEFTGVLSGGDNLRLAFHDQASDLSRWTKIGDSFSGFVVKSYDASKEEALLVQGATELRLKLVASKVRQGDSSVHLTPEIARSIFQNLRQIEASAQRWYLEHGVSTVKLDDLVGPGKFIKRLVPVAGEDYASLTLQQGVPVVFTAADGETIAASAGQKTGITYEFVVLQPGDTGMKAAIQSKSSLSDLPVLNPGVDFSRLRIGQVLRTKTQP